MPTQQASKAKRMPPHQRNVATLATIAATEQNGKQPENQVAQQVEKQIEKEVKRSQWTPPHLRKAQELPVTPISKPASSQLDPSSSEYRPMASTNNSVSPIRSVFPKPSGTASPAAIKLASPSESASPVSSKSNTGSGKTYLGLGLAGSRWAPARPTAEQIAIAEAPETIIKAKADLMAIHLVMDTQQELVDQRKKEALENGGEGLRYKSDYRKIREENEKRVADIAKNIIAKAGSAHSRSASDESQSTSPAHAPAKIALPVKDSTQVESVHSTRSDASASALSSAKEVAHSQATHVVPSVNKVEATTATTKESAQVQDTPVFERLGSASPAPYNDVVESTISSSDVLVEPTTSAVKESTQIQPHLSIRSSASVTPAKDMESTPVQTPTQATSDAGGFKEPLPSPVRRCEGIKIGLPLTAKPVVELATNFTLWNCQPKSLKNSGSSIARPKTVAFTTSFKSSAAPSFSKSTGGSQKAAGEHSNAAHSTGAHSDADHAIIASSIAAHSTALGLSADTTAFDCSSHSSAEDVTLETTNKMLVPVPTTPYKSQTAAPLITESLIAAAASLMHVSITKQPAAAPATPDHAAAPSVQGTGEVPKTKAPEPIVAPNTKAGAPIKLATTLEGFTDFRPAPRASLPPTNNMPRRNGWLSKAETKAMRSRPLSDYVIDEDAYDREIQNNDWPSADEDSPELCLRQWDGDWLPAPVDWAGRNQYKRADKFAEDIATWVNRTNNHYLVVQSGRSKITVKLLDAEGNMTTSENVPRSWVPQKIEGQSLQEFWNNLKQSSPEPLDADDLRFAPFWQRYVTSAHSDKDHEVLDFQEPLPGPDAVLDVADCGVILYKKGKNQTAETTSNQIADKKLRDAAKKEAIRQKHHKIMKKEAKCPVVAPPPNPHKPAANMYLRPATNRDDAQMALVYNHYANTHYSSAMAPMTASEIANMRQGIATANLNMVVAVLKVKQTGVHRANLQSTQEKIIGFAFTDEHEGPRSLFRYAADLEVFVHPEYARKGVGKSLVDRLVFLADSQYVSRDAVEWRPLSDDLHLTTAGGKRTIGTVHINVFYPIDEEERLVWLGTWLKQFKFELRGKILGGIKLQKNITMACFIHRNAQAINPVSARD